MPIYEYECPRCGCRFELKQSFNDAPRASCPRCQQAAQRVFIPATIIFKGSGFYITDSRKGSGEETGEKKETAKKQAGIKGDGDKSDKV